jgi:hypothetical protein
MRVAITELHGLQLCFKWGQVHSSGTAHTSPSGMRQGSFADPFVQNYRPHAQPVWTAGLNTGVKGQIYDCNIRHFKIRRRSLFSCANYVTWLLTYIHHSRNVATWSCTFPLSGLFRWLPCIRVYCNQSAISVALYMYTFQGIRRFISTVLGYTVVM